jgi:hypothetical protein
MNPPLSIAHKFHLTSALLTRWHFYLNACVSPIHQFGQRFAHQFTPTLAGFRFDLSKTRLRMRIVPVFQLVVHPLRFFHKCRLAAGARL